MTAPARGGSRQPPAGGTPPPAPVWVLDDPAAPEATEQAIGLAEHLGARFTRIPLHWTQMADMSVLAELAATARSGKRIGSPWAAHPDAPRLIISAGGRGAMLALWHKARLGCLILHIGRPRLPLQLLGPMFDMLVIPQHEKPPRLPNVLPMLGLPHRLSAVALASARAAWDERLAHLPPRRITLLAYGPGPGRLRGAGVPPALAHRLGQQAARQAIAAQAAVLVYADASLGAEASDALAAGLQPALHVLHRSDEPGPSPRTGFLAHATSLIVTAGQALPIAEACSTTAPTQLALPDLATVSRRRLIQTLTEGGHLGPLQTHAPTHPKPPLPEPARIAALVLGRVAVE